MILAWKITLLLGKATIGIDSGQSTLQTLDVRLLVLANLVKFVGRFRSICQ